MFGTCEKQESNVTREKHAKGGDYELRAISKARLHRALQTIKEGLRILLGVL